MSTPSERPGIVVGVDGSCASRVAVDWAARDAALRDISLSVVHVASGLGATLVRTSLPTGFGESQRQRGHQIIDEAVGIAEEATRGTGQSLPVRTEIYYSATVPTLVDLSKDAAMVVVGRRGQGALEALLGSTSSGLIHYAHCPVAVIHDEDPLMPHPAQAPVLVGVDGSPAAEWATAIAFEEASRRHVDLVALHAWSDATALDVPGLGWSSQNLSEVDFLAQCLAGWQDRYPDVRIHRRVVRDRPARQLIEQSEEAQLVVVGSRGRGGFAGMLLGSVSSAVIQSARMPVIVARRQ